MTPSLFSKQPPRKQTNTWKQICLNSLSCTLNVSQAHPVGRLPPLTTQSEGSPSTQASPFATWILPLKVPGVLHVRGSMKIPAKMAEQRSGVNLSPLVPLSRHFDVMAALCFVMWRSCQISGPVMAVSACLLGLTEPVMELRLNKRVITFLALGRTTLLYLGWREENTSVLHAHRRGGGEHVTLQPPSKRCKWEEKACGC